jgi:hypothetical protein
MIVNSFDISGNVTRPAKQETAGRVTDFVDTRNMFSPGLVIKEALGNARAPLVACGGILFMGPAIMDMQTRYLPAEQVETEMALEIVRRMSFPHFPCRQSCLYGYDSIEALRRIDARANRPGGMKGSIHQISGKGFRPFDGTVAYTRGLGPVLDCAECYWRGFRTPRPAFEFLVALPVTIGDQVGTL